MLVWPRLGWDTASMKGTWITFVAPFVAVGLAIPAASAQEPSPTAAPGTESPAAQEPTPTPTPSPTGVTSTVSLRVSDTLLTYGRKVRLSGKVSPIVPGSTVRIVHRDGSEVASVTPSDDGSYTTELVPERNLALTASWLEARSAERAVKVRPIVRLTFGTTRLFGRTTVSGSVRPASKARVKIAISNNGSPWKTMSLGAADGSFRTSVRITRLGRYRAKAFYRPEGLRTRKVVSASRRVAVPPSLSTGSRGAAVKRLEWRLRSLGYYLPKIDRRYGSDTSDAVIAFNKVQGRPRSGTVTTATWKALGRPIKPRPRLARGSHIEVDQTRQVIFVVRKGKVRWILHTSTGAGGASRDGSWTVHRKLEGYSPGRLYYPSYYDGLRAVHGWPEVPTYPASHGCARVPMWSATWIHSKMPHGTKVLVYH